MKILGIGAGSMGRRRLRDLIHLGAGEVMLFEPAADRCRETAAAFGIRGFTDFEEALAAKPDALSISTPPSSHELYVRRAVDLGLHVFAEVPFLMDDGALAEIAARAKTYPRVLGISHTIRHYPPYRIIHDLLQRGEIGRPLYLEYSLGNCLAEWHPYEDYRRFYGSDARLGGAGLDMILHELSPIQWWLGPVRSVYARLEKLSSLEVHGPDSHDVLLTFAGGARGFFHDDIIERGTMGRHVRIAGEDGTIEWHQNLPAVRLFHDQKNELLGFERASDWADARAASREMTGLLARQKARSGYIPSAGTSEFTYESCYLREMRHFVEAMQGKHPFTMTNLDEELANVRVFHAVLQSGEQHRELPTGL